MPNPLFEPAFSRNHEPDSRRDGAQSPAIVYPESDGLPMADNTRQYDYMVTIKAEVEALFPGPDIAVFGNLLWYPIEGDNVTCAAPDIMVIFGRPKGPRRSYRQWDEAGIAPQIVFEILSPANRAGEMARKLVFYERHGVEEYYVYDPDRERLTGYVRGGAPSRFVPIAEMTGWVSPRLGIRFAHSTGLTIYRPDGRPFESTLEMAQRADREGEARAKAEAARAKAEAARVKAEAARAKAEAARVKAEASRAKAQAAREKAEAARAKAEAARAKAEERAIGESARNRELIAKLRALGIEP